MVVVTGGSGSLGGALVRRLVAEGATAIAVARRLQPLEELCGSVRGPGQAIPAPGDVTVPADLEHIFAMVNDRFGRLDGLVNNAGGGAAAPFDSVTDEGWERDLQIKLFGAIRTKRLARPLFLAAGGGAVVNVLAVAAKAPGPSSLPTAVSRAAGMALTKAVANDWGGDRIRVNAVLVGVIKSANHASRAAALGQGVERYYDGLAAKRGVPLGRVGEPAEFADVGAFLLSPRSSYVTGAAINLDGGGAPVV